MADVSGDAPGGSPTEAPEPVSAKVIQFPGATYIDTPAEEILKELLTKKFDSLVVVGHVAGEGLGVWATTSYLPDVLWNLARGQYHINELANEPDDD